MLRRMVNILVIMVFTAVVGGISFAMDSGDESAESIHKHADAQTADSSLAGKVEEVGNIICPVSGEKINEKTKATFVYEGKVYNFCCAMCIDSFKKDPEKYIKKIEEEKQKEMKGEESAEHEHMHH